MVVQAARWEVCENSRYGGACVTLLAGSHANLRGVGLHDALSSARPVNARRTLSSAPEGPAPEPQVSCA